MVYRNCSHGEHKMQVLEQLN